jgi:HEAT repeat protein
VAGAALHALHRLLAVDSFGGIVPLLDRPDLREAAQTVLGQTAARGLAGKVRPLVDSADPATRGAAAAALGGMGAHEHAAAVAGLLGSDDAVILLKATGALGRMAAEEQAERIAPLLKHGDPYVRAIAAQALGRMGARRFGAALLPLLRDPVTDVRDAAGAALGELLPEDKVGEVSALLIDRDAVVRGLAARALGQAGVRGRAKEITQVLDWEHPWSRGRAIRALGGLGAVEHLDRIIDLTRDEWDVVRIASAAALCDLAPLPWPEGARERAIAKLRESRKDFGDEAPRAAAAALVVLEGAGQAGQREVLELLDERDGESIPVLLEGLARIHEKKGHAALDREIQLERAVDSLERVQEELAKAGLALDLSDDPRVIGRIPAGRRATPRKLLAALWEGTVAVPQGDRVRVLDPLRALQVWRDRLDQPRKK